MSHPQPSPSSTLPHVLSLLPQHIPLSPLPPNKTLTPLISSPRVHPTIEALLHLLNSDLPSAHFLCRHMQAPPAVEGMLLHAILHRAEGDWGNAKAWLGDVGRDGEGENEDGDRDGRSRFVDKDEKVPKNGEKHKSEDEDDGGLKTGNVGNNGAMEGTGRGVKLLHYVYGSMPLSITTDEPASDKALQVAFRLLDMVQGFRMRSEGSQEALNSALRHETRQLLDWCVRAFGEGTWEDASGAWARAGEKVRKIGEEMVSGNKGWRKF